MKNQPTNQPKAGTSAEHGGPEAESDATRKRARENEARDDEVIQRRRKERDTDG